MTRSKYITSPPSDMVLPDSIVSPKGNVYEIEEALAVTRTVLQECISQAEHSYIQDNVLKKALKRSAKHLYSMRGKPSLYT